MTAVAASSTAMTAVASYQNSMDKIWAQPDTAVAKVCANATGMAALVAKQSTIQGFGYAAVNSDLDYGTWNGKKLFIQNGKRIVCNYSGAIKSATFPKGTYKLEVYGAQGGGTDAYAGKGGYSLGTKAISAATVLYLVVGGRGATTTSSAACTGGYNGGGQKYKGIGNWSCSTQGAGGGATHIATATGLLSALSGNKGAVLIVAGGGGGSGAQSNSSNNNHLGGAGGGTSGGNGGYWCVGGGYGGTQTAGGGSNYGSSCRGPGETGSFGQGGAGGSPSAGNSWCSGGGGGGGWYGGGGAGWGCGAASGGGGSGYIGGVTSGSMTNGSRSGNGLAYITRNS